MPSSPHLFFFNLPGYSPEKIPPHNRYLIDVQTKKLHLFSLYSFFLFFLFLFYSPLLCHGWISFLLSGGRWGGILGPSLNLHYVNPVVWISMGSLLKGNGVLAPALIYDHETSWREGAIEPGARALQARSLDQYSGAVGSGLRQERTLPRARNIHCAWGQWRPM